VANDAAPPGKALKYARIERERRFLLRGRPDVKPTRTTLIADGYLIGTRIRLRKSIEWDGTGQLAIYKLTQKIPRTDDEPALITTMYLTEAEFQALENLPATRIEKTRLSIPPYGVDVFHGDLDGLYLAEVEFDTDQEMAGFTPAPFIVAEVTDDPRLTGASLTTADRATVAVALAEYGVTMSAPSSG
jgi:CYTH domain-containing protein